MGSESAGGLKSWPNQRSKTVLMKECIPIEAVVGKIYLSRGQKVLLGRDLAKLYGVVVF
jgi:hypothetical protein